MNIYKHYLKGNDCRVDRLAVFEIGPKSDQRRTLDRPIVDTFYDRIKNADICYFMGIDDPNEMGHAAYESSPVWYREVTKGLLDKETVPGGRLDGYGIVPWDARDTPYPFENNSFDEFHCHMITACVVKMDGAPGEVLSPLPYQFFIQEMSRLLADEGRAYLTIQSGLFFGRDKKACENFTQDLVQFVKGMESEFKIELVHTDPGIVGEVNQLLDYEANAVDVESARLFTAEAESLDALIIATKR